MSTTTASPIHPSSDLEPSVDALAARVAGRVLVPGAEEYAEVATPFNVAVPATHLVAVEAVDAADVVACVRFAAEQGLEVVVQATGHGASATGRPSLLLLTRLLDEVSIDPAVRSARVGAGVRWARVIEEAAAYGLAGVAGSAPGVGVVGYLTGGGLSPVGRTFGWASDRVTAFDVVTGDGELRRATPTENAALFWGLRGGKGALGVVTAVEMELVPLAEMYAGCLYFAGEDAPAVLHAWREWSRALPEQASTSVAVLRLPPLPNVPPRLAGRTTVAVRFAWVGDPDEGARVVSPMQQVAPVVFGGVGVMPFAAMGMIHADPADPMPVLEHSLLLGELPPEAVDALLGHVGAEVETPQVVVEVRLLGGALARTPEQPSALGHRDAAYTLLAIGIAAPPVVEASSATGRAILSAMEEWGTGGVLPNFAPTADPAETARRYDAATYARIGTLAATYDPEGVIAAAAGFRR